MGKKQVSLVQVVMFKDPSAEAWSGGDSFAPSDGSMIPDQGILVGIYWCLKDYNVTLSGQVLNSPPFITFLFPLTYRGLSCFSILWQTTSMSG